MNEQAPNCEVRAFGSRLEGNADKYSDLDLVLVGNEELN
jgi:predicted nucleotidyltransferase